MSDASSPVSDIRSFMAEVNRVMAAPTAAGCAQLARTLHDVPAEAVPWPEVKVGLLGSFTNDPLVPFVVAYGAGSGVLVRAQASGGDSWTQDVLDRASALRQFSPDVIVVALEIEDLADRLVHDYLGLGPGAVADQVQHVVARVSDLVMQIRQWSSAKILLHTVPAPAEPTLGFLDGTHTRGQTAAFAEVNRGIRDRLAATRDVYFVDVDRLIRRVGAAAWHDRRMWMLARIPYTTAAMQALADEYTRHLRAFTGRVRKVLVVDLDDTLWGGIVGEDGPDGIQLGVGYRGRAFVNLQRALRDLARRGVLLAINSKNNPEDAFEVLDQHPSMVLRRDDFAAIRVNWQDKATNLVELAGELGLGLDSFVFVDDNAVECDRIRQALPEVLTIQLSGDPANYAQTIRSLGVFDSLSFGEEDQGRTAMYRSEAQRRELQETVASLDDFYRSLEMRLEVAAVSAATLPRAAELTQRTNQFNLMTRRFTADELRDYLAQPQHEGFVFRLRDRFGDHGIIGLALLEGDGDALVVGNLLMSCRVLKRTVEDSILAFIFERAAAAGARTVDGLFKPTRKNVLAAGLYDSHGFQRIDDAANGAARYRRAAADPVPASPWIVTTHTEQGHV
jgi:FkbH-like protein